MPYDKEYKSNIVIICVRNPIDVFVSQFLQLCSMTHNLVINEPFHETYPEWDWSFGPEIKCFKKWYKYWIDKAESNEMPVFFMRFEDLLKDPKKELTDIFSFIL